MTGKMIIHHRILEANPFWTTPSAQAPLSIPTGGSTTQQSDHCWSRFPYVPLFKVILIVLAQLVSIIPSPQLVLPSGVTHNCEIPEKDHPVITDGTETLGNHMCRGPNMFVFF